MSFPVPTPGLVIRYSYLWRREAEAGREEGVKDRPCAVVVAFDDAEGRQRVVVLPITHTPSQAPAIAVELPRLVSARLGLDSQRSWIVVSEANAFTWPGPDLRPGPGRGSESVAYGMLPPKLFKIIRDLHLSLAAEGRVLVVDRSE